MVKWNALILKFEKNGEKSAWTYIQVPLEIAHQIKPNTRISFRIKGKLDAFPIKSMALIPIGEGDFILPINQNLRKALKKQKNHILEVEMEEDTDPVGISDNLWECLQDEPQALEKFQAMPKSHQNYYSFWVDSCKTESTKALRIARVVSTLLRGMNFAEMLRENKKERE